MSDDGAWREAGLLLIAFVLVQAVLVLAFVFVMMYRVRTDGAAFAWCIGLSAICIGADALLFRAMRRVVRARLEGERAEALAREVDAYIASCGEGLRRSEHAAHLRHDLRNHFQTVATLTERGDLARARDYLSDLSEAVRAGEGGEAAEGSERTLVVDHTPSAQAEGANPAGDLSQLGAARLDGAALPARAGGMDWIEEFSRPDATRPGDAASLSGEAVALADEIATSGGAAAPDAIPTMTSDGVAGPNEMRTAASGGAATSDAISVTDGPPGRPHAKDARRRLSYLAFPASQALVVVAFTALSYAHGLGWPVRVVIAVLAVLSAIADVALFRLLAHTQDERVEREHVRLLERQLASQRERRAALDAQADQARLIRVNLISELRRIAGLLASDDVRASAIAEELGALSASLGSRGRYLCAHPAVDALMAAKVRACEERGIRLDLHLDVPAELSLQSLELCAAFSNVMDNAIAACGELPRAERWIELDARVVAGMFVIWARNACAGVAAATGDRGAGEGRRFWRGRAKPADAERERALPEHGWGLQILEAIAARHHGALDVERLPNEFQLTVSLAVSQR